MYMVFFKYSAEALDEMRVTDDQMDEVRAQLIAAGMTHNQGNSYMVRDPIKAIITFTTLNNENRWWGACLAMIRMLRIEDNIDILPLIPNLMEYGIRPVLNLTAIQQTRDVKDVEEIAKAVQSEKRSANPVKKRALGADL